MNMFSWNIHGVTMYGRGGNGGSNSPGSAGGHCIQNDIGGRLRINNGGAIAGGGGGGYYSPFPQMRLTFGGDAGYAVIGSAPTWINVGAIYGPRV